MLLKWHFWQSAIFQHDLLDPLTPVLLTSSAFIKACRSRGQSTVCWWAQMPWIFSTHSSDFFPPASPGSKSQSSFHWRCSGRAVGVCDFKVTEENGVVQRVFLVFENLLWRMWFTPGDCRFLTGLCWHSSGREHGLQRTVSFASLSCQSQWTTPS